MTLRVTDVQAALRHFTNIGHDVLSDPRAVHLDGKRYGMAVGHDLLINDRPTIQGVGLTSHVSQAERPVISQINTFRKVTPSGTHENVHRYIDTLVPTIVKLDEDWLHHAYLGQTHTNIGTHADNASHPVGEMATWGMGKSTDKERFPHEDAHEALKAHTDPASPYYGSVSSEEHGNVKMTSEDMRSFKHKEALSRLSPEPYKGLVVVQHAISGGLSTYLYNPHTEQLHTLGDRD